LAAIVSPDFRQQPNEAAKNKLRFPGQIEKAAGNISSGRPGEKLTVYEFASFGDFNSSEAHSMLRVGAGRSARKARAALLGSFSQMGDEAKAP
jgi:hypothetical protein